MAENNKAKEFLHNLDQRIKNLSEQIRITGEDLSYNIKLYFRETGLNIKKWCGEKDLSYDDLKESLKNDDFFRLKEYLQVILYGTSKINIRNGYETEEKNKIGVNSIIKGLNSNDPGKLWSSISYYILMNHKNIRTFCENLNKKNFSVKYSTFRTDKYNKGMNSAIKYANIILEYVKLSEDN